MTTNFPNSADSFINPASTDPMNNPSHSEQHDNLNDAVVAIENYLLQNLPSGVSYISINEKGQAGGVAELDGSGKVPLSQLPPDAMEMISVSDSDYYMTADDFGRFIYLNSSSDQTVHLLEPSDETGMVGKSVIFYATSSGVKTITSQFTTSTGANPNAPQLRTIFSGAVAVYGSEWNWVVMGDIV